MVVGRWRWETRWVGGWGCCWRVACEHEGGCTRYALVIPMSRRTRGHARGQTCRASPPVIILLTRPKTVNCHIVPEPCSQPAHRLPHPLVERQAAGTCRWARAHACAGCAGVWQCHRRGRGHGRAGVCVGAGVGVRVNTPQTTGWHRRRKGRGRRRNKDAADEEGGTADEGEARTMLMTLGRYPRYLNTPEPRHDA